MIIDKKVIKPLEFIKELASSIYVRIRREKWKAVSIDDMTALEFIDVLILWINQERDIGWINQERDIGDNINKEYIERLKKK